jgi:hypothetical protein
LSDLAEALANPIKYQSEREKREKQLSVLTDDTEVEVPEDQLGSTPGFLLKILYYSVHLLFFYCSLW